MKSPARKLTYVKPKDAWRHRQGSASKKGFAGLSLVPALQFCCAGVFAFRFPIVGVLSLVLAITTTHCTIHISVAWQRGITQKCNTGNGTVYVIRPRTISI